MAALEDPINPPAIAAPPRPPLLRRVAAKLREQTRFSLATMLEWMAAYTLAFAAAWSRADNVLLTGACLGVMGSGLVLRIALRSEGRRIPHYLVYSLAMALGAYSGAYVLRDQRVRAAEAAVQSDLQAIAVLEEELASSNKTLAKTLSE